MATGNIRVVPTLSDEGFGAGELVAVSVPVTLPDGVTLADFASFAWYVWEDPEYPREGSHAFVRADPARDGWELVATLTGSAAGSTVTYTGTMPDPAGYRRYVAAAWALGGTAGPSCLVKPAWLTLTPGR